MKIPWKRKVRISMDDDLLVNMIIDLLSDRGTVWQYRSIFQEFIIDRNVRDLNEVKQRIYEWLKRIL